MSLESENPEASRTKHPGSYFVATLILVIACVLDMVVRHSDTPFLVLFFPSILFAIAGLYFGERTFLPVRSRQRIDRVSPHVRRNLRIARRCFFWLFVLNIAIDVALGIAFQRYGLVFQITGFAFLILSYSVADFLGEPMYRPQSPVTSLKI